MSSGNRTRTLDDTTHASDPGAITLSHAKLRLLRPDLYGISGLWLSIMAALGKAFPQRTYIEEQLRFGDSRAAVVVSPFPLLIAAYTDELDCVAILHFHDGFAHRYGLHDGARLLTVNCYGDSKHYDEDLIPGPGMIKRWTGFHPIIADFVTDDYQRLAARKREITEHEWRRAFLLGKEYIAMRPGLARDGRPVYSAIPATVPMGM